MRTDRNRENFTLSIYHHFGTYRNFRRNGHLVGRNLSNVLYLLPLQHLKTYE